MSSKPIRAHFEVGDVTFKSKAALQRAWKSKSALLRVATRDDIVSAADDGGIVEMSADDAAFYIRAAWASVNKRSRLHPKSCAGVKQALGATRVFVARADLKYPGNRRLSKTRAVFFANSAGGCLIAVGTNLGDDPELEDRAAVYSRMRNAIDRQINDFRFKFGHTPKGKRKRTALRCAQCRLPLVGVTHVDHGTGPQSFVNLAREWMRREFDEPG